MQCVSSICLWEDLNSLFLGEDGVKPSIPLSSLKLFIAQQCAHACHAVIVFFREVTFHLYLKTPDACQSLSLSLSLSLLAIHSLLSVGTLMKYAFIKAHWSLWLLPLTTRSHVGKPVNQLLTQLCKSEAFLSLLWEWVSLVKWSFSSTDAAENGDM